MINLLVNFLIVKEYLLIKIHIFKIWKIIKDII